MIMQGGLIQYKLCRDLLMAFEYPSLLPGRGRHSMTIIGLEQTFGLSFLTSAEDLNTREKTQVK